MAAEGLGGSGFMDIVLQGFGIQGLGFSSSIKGSEEFLCGIVGLFVFLVDDRCGTGGEGSREQFVNFLLLYVFWYCLILGFTARFTVMVCFFGTSGVPNE